MNFDLFVQTEITLPGTVPEDMNLKPSDSVFFARSHSQEQINSEKDQIWGPAV